MRILLRRLATLLLMLAVMVGGLLLALRLARPDLFHRITASYTLPDVGPAPAILTAITTIARAMLALAGFTLTLALAGRALGRYLRRPGDSRLPGRAGEWVDARRSELRPTVLEIRLGRNDETVPYAVAKMFDGVAGAARPRWWRRLALGPDALDFLWIQDPAARKLWIAVAARPGLHDLLHARLRATYRDVRVRPLDVWADLDVAGPAEALRDRLRRRAAPSSRWSVVRLKKARRALLTLQTTKDYEHSTPEALVGRLGVAKVPAIVSLHLIPTPRLTERWMLAALRRRERRYRSETAADVTEGGIDSAVAQQQIKGATEGIGSAFFWFDWRIMVPAGQQQLARDLAGILEETRRANELRPRSMRIRRRLYAWRVRHHIASPLTSWWSGALNSAELATCWHLPTRRAKAVPLDHATARTVAAGPQISSDPADALLTCTETGRPLGLRPADRRYGMVVLGGQGGGKSSILLRYVGNVARDRSRALVLVDPKEDLARAALAVIPTERTVHYLDLARPRFGLNPLLIAGVEPHVAADTLIAAIRETAAGGASAVGDRSDELLRNALTAVAIVEERPTIYHARRLLDPFDGSYREWLVRELDNKPDTGYLRDFYSRELPTMVEANPRAWAEWVNAPRNKLGRLLGVPQLSVLFNHPQPLDLLGIIRRREVLIINGSKAGVGEDNANLVCALLVMLVQRMLHQQQTIADERQRSSVALVIDEMHQLLGPVFARMLAEARSAGVEVAGALQYTDQIEDETVRSGVESLLQSVFITRTRKFEDARRFAALALTVYSDAIRGEIEDQNRLVIDPLDIINMQVHRALGLCLADQNPQPPFTGDTIPVAAATGSPHAAATARHHLDVAASSGWHPHDDDVEIEMPHVYDARRPITVTGRRIYADITAMPNRPASTDRVIFYLRPFDLTTPWVGFAGRPDDRSGRRWRAYLPHTGPAEVRPGRYFAHVTVIGPGATAHRWTPRTIPADPRATPQPMTVDVAALRRPSDLLAA